MHDCTDPRPMMAAMIFQSLMRWDAIDPEAQRRKAVAMAHDTFAAFALVDIDCDCLTQREHDHWLFGRCHDLLAFANMHVSSDGLWPIQYEEARQALEQRLGKPKTFPPLTRAEQAEEAQERR